MTRTVSGPIRALLPENADELVEPDYFDRGWSDPVTGYWYPEPTEFEVLGEVWWGTDSHPHLTRVWVHKPSGQLYVAHEAGSWFMKFEDTREKDLVLVTRLADLDAEVNAYASAENLSCASPARLVALREKVTQHLGEH